MELDFITMEMFLSFAGCLAVVAILTQTVKSLPGLNKINSLWSTFICSIFVGVIRLLFMHDFTVQGLIVGILNIFAIYLGAIGGYETIKQIVQRK